LGKKQAFRSGAASTSGASRQEEKKQRSYSGIKAVASVNILLQAASLGEVERGA